MPDIPFFWLLVVGAIVLSSVVGGAQRVRARRAREQWAAAAEQLGFSLAGTSFRTLAIAGSEGSISVAVDLVRTDNSTTTRYRIDLPPLGFGLKLSRQSEWHQFVKAFGAQDVEIDNPDFDDQFMVKTTSPDRTRRYLILARVTALNTLAAQHPGFSFADGQLLLSTGGMAKDGDRIVSTVRDLMETARALLPATSEVPVEEPLGTADGSATSEASAEEVEGIAAASMDEPDRGSREQEHPREFKAPAHDHPPSMPPTVANSSAEFAATRLFGEQQLGFEVERRFNDEYQGTTVDWTGTVQREGGMSAGRRFEGDDHSIIEIKVATIEDDLYGETSVDAVVAFPAGSEIPQRGDTVRFSGRLIAIDALTKDLYVADGRIAEQ